MLSPGSQAGVVIIGSLLAGAGLFRTYGLEVTPIGLEIVRHFGLFFLICEIAVVAIAARAGHGPLAVWRQIDAADRVAVLTWLALFWVGSVSARNPGYALAAVAAWPIHLLFGAAVYQLAARPADPARHARSVRDGVGIVVLGLLLVALLHLGSAWVPEGGAGGVFWPGAVPGFMSVRLFGVVMCYAALLGAGMLLRDGGGSDRWRSGLLLLFAVGAMCWSSTRAALPAYLGGLLVAAVILGRSAGWRAWSTIVGITVTAGFLSLLVPAPSPDFGTANMLVLGAPGPAGPDITSGRIDIWRAVVAAIVERPMLGHGEGATRWLVGNSAHVQPHNIVLQVVLHWGAIAGLAALWMAGRLGWAMCVAVRQRPALVPFAMIVAGAVCAAMLDGALYYPQMVMIAIAALAVTLGWGRDDADERQGA